ncbi:MAG: DNA translocase FtsK 4TM domain-containing protein, partial [Eggerthellaceae bacterium]|nr:DNA translocase FtsK 4TM domain-containing protein [Eggerthellaceae bacterium]
MSKKLVSSNIKFDIAGIAMIIMGLVFMVMAFMCPSGAITAPLSQAMHLVFGIGAYIFPVILIIVGVLYIIKSSELEISKHFAIGSGLILLSVLVIVAICTKLAEDDPSKYLFIAANLYTHGGYIGAGIAWMLLVLLGKTIALLIMIGVMLVGFVFLGLSASKAIKKYKDKLQEKIDSQEEAAVDMTPERLAETNMADMNDRMIPVPTRILDSNSAEAPAPISQDLGGDDALTQLIDREEEEDEAAPTVLLKRDKGEEEDVDDGFQDAPTVIID